MFIYFSFSINFSYFALVAVNLSKFLHSNFKMTIVGVGVGVGVVVVSIGIENGGGWMVNWIF